MTTGKPPKILISGNDPSLIKALRHSLSTEGCKSQISISRDGQEGLFLSRSEFFNVIVLAASSPQIDGLSLLSKIKNFSSMTEIIIIADHWNAEAAAQSFELGAHDYLISPVDPTSLLQVVKKALDKQALGFENRRLIAEIKFKDMLLEEQRDLLEHKLIENDQRIYRLINQEIFAKRLFEKVIQSLPFGAMVIDKEGRVVMCNSVQETFSGLPRDSLLGKNIFQESLSEGLKPWREMARDFLSKKSYEVKVVDQRLEKDRILSITLSSLINIKESTRMFIFLTTDITNQKRIEEQIIQSEKMTAIGQLATNLAHQIRNPLAIIGSATQCCIEKGESINGFKKHFEIIYRNVQNANTIITDLLDFAKPKILEFRENDINQILIELYRLIKVDFSKNRIRILRRFDRYLPKILCDEESLKQAFFNLLMNSKQAIPNGGAISIITSHEVNDPMVSIVIKDTGKGIPKKQIPNIFNPYFTTKEKGTGLGLSIVHRIITDHHGKIVAESKDEKGTKITITLPSQSRNQDLRGQNERDNAPNSYRG